MSEEGKRQEKKDADDPEAGRRAGCRKAKDKPGVERRGWFTVLHAAGAGRGRRLEESSKSRLLVPLEGTADDGQRPECQGTRSKR